MAFSHSIGIRVRCFGLTYGCFEMERFDKGRVFFGEEFCKEERKKKNEHMKEQYIKK